MAKIILKPLPLPPQIVLFICSCNRNYFIINETNLLPVENEAYLIGSFCLNKQ